jgi:hypothetical protein
VIVFLVEKKVLIMNVRNLSVHVDITVIIRGHMINAVGVVESLGKYER